MTRRVFSVIVLLVVCASSVEAQTNPVPAGQPFSVAWDANPASDNVTSYRCYVDKVKVGSDVPVASARLCTIPGQTVGSHVVEVSAVNVFGEGARSGATATAGSPPSAPSNFRIIVQVAVQQDGSVTLLASSVEKVPFTP